VREVPVLVQAGPRRRALGRLGGGAGLLLAAVVVFAASRVLADLGEHAYDPGASPPATVTLLAGHTYHLSSPGSVAALQGGGVLSTLSCTWTAPGQPDFPLPLTAVLGDERTLHVFAAFTAPASGALRIGCTDVGRVFVDDAPSSPADRAALLVLVTVLLALAGGVLAVSGCYGLCCLPPGGWSHVPGG
jgi:hypothetical protein